MTKALSTIQEKYTKGCISIASTVRAKVVNHFAKQTKGQAMVEYGVIIAVVVIGLIAVMGNMRQAISEKFQYAISELSKSK